MHRFKNILLVYESDRPALERAAALAKENGAQLTVVQVIRELPAHWRQIELGTTQLNLEKLLLEECQARLTEFVAPVKHEGIPIETKVLTGIPFVEITREVMRHQRDLVILTAEGRGGWKEWLFGSTTMHLIRKCPCPVWVMKPGQGKGFKKVLAAVDPDPDNVLRDALNRTIMELGSSLAAKEQGELHVAHAWDFYLEPMLRSRARLSEEEVEQIVSRERNRHWQEVTLLAQNYPAVSPRVHLLRGKPEEIIPHLTKAEGIDLLVVGTICRTGILGFFIGNTAERILNEVDCSVLTVKPEGFVSPVTLV